jgi:cation diffusion facilitator family transporter
MKAATEQPAEQSLFQGYRLGTRTTLVGLMVNGGLALIKLLAGLLGHSYALVADAVESMADIFGSLVVWHGLRVASRPADADHPYGHGRAEPLAGLVVSMMLFGAAIGIAIEAVREILKPHHAPAAFTLWVLLGVVAVKELLFRFVSRVGRTLGSGAVTVDAWHHRSDAITSAAAAIGIATALTGGEGYEPADDWAALFAAGVIFANAWRLMRVPLHELMDAEPVEIIERVRKVALRAAGVKDVEKVFARKIGLRYRVDLHVEVDPDMSVRQAHELSHGVKDTICEAMPEIEDVLVHIEPHDLSRLPGPNYCPARSRNDVPQAPAG